MLVHGDGKHFGLSHEQREEADQEDDGACYCHGDCPYGHVAPGDVKGVRCHLPHVIAVEVVPAGREAKQRVHHSSRRCAHEHGVGKWLPGARHGDSVGHAGGGRGESFRVAGQLFGDGELACALGVWSARRNGFGCPLTKCRRGVTARPMLCGIRSGGEVLSRRRTTEVAGESR